MPSDVTADSRKTATLGSLCLKEPDYGISATAIERTSDGQPKYIRITDFSDNGIADNHIFTSVAGYQDKHVLNKNDILFARSGATVGKTFKYDSSLGLAVFAGYCIRFVIDGLKVMPEYVYWYTKTAQYADWVQKLQRPSGQPNINKEEYKTLEIPLIPRGEQERIVAEIEAANARRAAKLREANALLSEMGIVTKERLGIFESPSEKRLTFAVRRGELKSRLDVGYNASKAMGNTFRYAAAPVSDICEIVAGQSPEGAYYNKEGSGTPFYQGNVDFDNVFIKRPSTWTTQVTKLAKANDVLLSVRAPVGAVNVCTGDICIGRGLMALRCTPAIDYMYLFYALNVCVGELKKASAGSIFGAVTKNDVAELLIPVPPKDVQQNIVAEVHAMRNRALALKREAETEWAAARARFENELLEGKVSVDD